jgi:hypothetical protein
MLFLVKLILFYQKIVKSSDRFEKALITKGIKRMQGSKMDKAKQKRFKRYIVKPMDKIKVKLKLNKKETVKINLKK